jgi:hypothetical protein
MTVDFSNTGKVFCCTLILFLLHIFCIFMWILMLHVFFVLLFCTPHLPVKIGAWCSYSIL